MRPFLRQVVDHYFNDATINSTLFIFPNRRSLAFFRKYLTDAIHESEMDKPVLEPEMLTISDFFSRVSGRSTSDRISLLLKLYECYSGLNPKAESLDDFIYWGDVLLGDFDDVDKYLVDPHQLFRNISELKSIRDDYSHLSDVQAEAMERLGAHFAPERRKTVEKGKADVKANFEMIWNILLPLYDAFRKKLAEDNLAYEGLIFRDMAERLGSNSAKDILDPVFKDVTKYVFVGLNALNECEKTVMRRMKDAALAEFCWDFPGEMIKDRSNASSHFMQTMNGSNLELFPNAFEPETRSAKTRVHVIAVPSATGQAKMLPDIITSVPEGERALDFAIVLPDETMLMPVLNSIPESVGKINITMGCPLATSEFATLMREILAMQLHLRNKDGRFYYNHKQVWAILSTGIMKSAMDDRERSCFSNIRKAAKFNIPQEDFCDSPLFKTIFTPVVTDVNASDASQIEALAEYQLDVVSAIARYLVGRETDQNGDAVARQPLQLEFARQYYCCINNLRGRQLAIRPQTWVHLVAQMASGQSVPFIGEPLQGMQVMGPLETRALDFRHMVILNCSEGVFPRRSVSSSFIPPELRSAFNLPTYAYQDAVWAYYFYRMIARADDVWMIYDSRTEGLKSGEESRYIKQLRFLYSDKVDFQESIAKASSGEPESEAGIPKTAEDVEKIRTLTYSASSFLNYLKCPAFFYYYSIKELKVNEEVSETMDAGTMGNVCHSVLESIYGQAPEGKVDEGYLKGCIGRENEIRSMVHDTIKKKLKCVDVSGKNLIDAEVALRFVLKVMKRDIDLIREKGNLTILGTELRCNGVEICGHRFNGIIDRLDRFNNDGVRVVDYKTGGDKPEVLKKPKVLELFNGNTDTKAAFQFYVYDRFVSSMKKFEGMKIDNSMYAMSDIFTNPVEVYDEPNEFAPGGVMEQTLTEKFKEMEDIDIPFKRVEDERKCVYCDYKSLCGRYPKKN